MKPEESQETIEAEARRIIEGAETLLEKFGNSESEFYLDCGPSGQRFAKGFDGQEYWLIKRQCIKNEFFEIYTESCHLKSTESPNGFQVADFIPKQFLQIRYLGRIVFECITTLPWANFAIRRFCLDSWKEKIKIPVEIKSFAPSKPIFSIMEIKK